MELRRNPRRNCKSEELSSILAKTSVDISVLETTAECAVTEKVQRSPKRKYKHQDAARICKRSTIKPIDLRTIHSGRPFRFFDLPRELRDEVYSCLVLRHNPDNTQRAPIDATTILKDQRKRISSQASRDRSNRRRVANGKPPICQRSKGNEPIVELNLFRSCTRLHDEASEHFYGKNWFSISLAKLPSVVIETPHGWNLGRIKRLQLDLQLKDAVRMNSYVDWATFFAPFASLRSLRIIPTFHPRYYDWANTEFCDWKTIHHIHKAFFRELLAAVPAHIELKFGPLDEKQEEKECISKAWLLDMYTELGSRLDHNGRKITPQRIVT
jgi:hypothetical protein